VHKRGVRGTLWEIYRRRLTPGLRLPLILGTWLLAIFTVVWILWRTQSLEGLQARLVSSLAAGKDLTGDAICKVVALRTRDNNTGRYYRAILTLARDFNQAGAKFVMAEQSRLEGPHSQWRSVLDSLTRLGVLLFESGEGMTQALPLPNPAPGDWRHAQLLYQARLLPEENPTMIAFRPIPSWYSQQLHCALHAVALLRGERTIQQPLYLDGAIRYADLRIPVTGEGESFAPLDARFRRTTTALVFFKEESDSLLYMDDSHSESAPTISPSLASLVRGQIVMIRWVDTGGLGTDWKETRSTVLPSLIEALQRGRLITPAKTWHHLVSVVVLLLGAGLALGKHLRAAFGVMMVVAAAILTAAVWLYSSQSVLADLIYPALAAILAGALFPAATHFHRHP
jgi:hypothetical protein